MGRGGNYQYAENPSMLKRLFLFPFLIFLVCSVHAKNVAVHSFYPSSSNHEMSEIWKAVSERIQNHLVANGFRVSHEAPDTVEIQFIQTSQMAFDFQIGLYGKAGNRYSVEPFRYWESAAYKASLTLLESLVLIDSLRSGPDQRTLFSYFPNSYEYAHFSEDGRWFFYISDKHTGNTNPVLIDLQTMREKILVFPQTSEIFPWVVDELSGRPGPWLFFVISGEKEWELKVVRIPEGSGVILMKPFESRSLDSGDIYSLSRDGEYLYYIRDGKIIQMNLETLQRWVLQPPLTDYFAQSMDVRDGLAIVSLLVGTHYNLFLWDLHGNDWQALTHTQYQEVDVRWSHHHPWFVYSANPNGTFQIFIRNLMDAASRVLVDQGEDFFYPAFSPCDRFVVCSAYSTSSSPSLILLPTGIDRDEK